jgi:hypothetical protein
MPVSNHCDCKLLSIESFVQTSIPTAGTKPVREWVMTKEKTLLTPLTVGPYKLRNRVLMAPLTRTRAGDRNVPVK